MYSLKIFDEPDGNQKPSASVLESRSGATYFRLFSSSLSRIAKFVYIRDVDCVSEILDTDAALSAVLHVVTWIKIIDSHPGRPSHLMCEVRM